MAYAGARGETEQQMARVLHFGNEQSRVHAAFGELQHGLNEAQKTGAIELNVANALWTQQGYPFVPDFLKVATVSYHAKIGQADFKTGAEPAREEINQWVARQTKEKIRDILPPGSLNQFTRLVLANAIYFKGAWSTRFREAETETKPFYLTSTKKVNVPLMHHFDDVKYVATTNFQAIELPYRGEGISMVIFLPRHVAGCGQLESWLNSTFISQCLAQMKKQKVEIFLPKFEMESTFGLNGILTNMGMTEAFKNTADFSGIDGTKLLSISSVVHKAWVEVNE